VKKLAFKQKKYKLRHKLASNTTDIIHQISKGDVCQIAIQLSPSKQPTCGYT